MTMGEIAGLAAAAAFCVLVALVAVPLLKLGRVLDELRIAVRDVGRGTTPILDELRGTVEATNTELEKLAVVTEDAATVSGHATRVSRSAAEVADLVGATLAAPLRPFAALGGRMRRALEPPTPTRTRERDR